MMIQEMDRYFTILNSRRYESFELYPESFVIHPQGSWIGSKQRKAIDTHIVAGSSDRAKLIVTLERLDAMATQQALATEELSAKAA